MSVGLFLDRRRLHSEALEPPAGHIQSPAGALPRCRWAAASPQYHPAGQSAEGQPAPLSTGQIIAPVAGTIRPHIRLRFRTSVCDNCLLDGVSPQGLSAAASLSQSQGAYLKEQLRLVTCRYLEHFLPASPSAGVIANHPVLLSACEVHPTPRGASLRRTVLEVLW